MASALAVALWLAIPTPTAALGGQSLPHVARAQAGPTGVEPEALLIRTLLAIKNNQLDVALAEVEKVLLAYPNFRLAHLIKGDLLAARAIPLSAMGAGAGAAPERVADLRQEARARLARSQQERPADRVPR